MDSDPILPPPVPAAAPSGFEPPAHAAPQVTVLDVVPPTKRSKKGWLVGGLALVAVVAGLVAFGLSRGGSERESYSFAAAVDGSQTATKFAYEINMDVSFMDIAITGQMDLDAQLMSMEMETPLADAPMAFIIDGKAQLMYLDAEALGGGGFAPTRWISVDLSQVPDAQDMFTGGGTSDPVSMAKTLVGAENVEEIGMEEFRGEQLKHYRVTMPIDAALEANPDLADQFDEIGSELPEELVYDVYVTEDNMLRRLVMELPVSDMTMEMEMVMTEIETLDDVTIPPADEVTDMTDEFLAEQDL